MNGVDSLPGRTPPMGWNSWNAYSCEVTEADIRDAADAMVETGLRDSGYEYLIVDDCWMAEETDEDGTLQPHPTKFPGGIADLAAYVHSRGLKFGLYSSAGTSTCQGYPASLGREHRHATQFAEWGVDYLKYDNCGHHQGQDAIERYAAMGEALRDVDRQIVYSICEWGQNDPWLWGRNVGASLWRTTDDVVAKWQAGGDEFGLGILDIIDRTAALNIGAFHGPHGWNDPDMLQIGNGPRSGQSEHEPVDVQRPLTEAESRTHFGFWCLLAAPLLVGTDLRELSPTEQEILTNEHLIAIDQDPLGFQATPVRREDTTEVWNKRLSDGGAAVGLLNRGSETTEIRTSVSDLALAVTADQYHVRQCWTGEDWETTGELGTAVAPRDTVVFRVTPR